MKFAVVAVILAIALSIECSVVPWIPGVSYTAVGAPVVVAGGPSIATIRGPAAVPLVHGPAAVAVHVPAPVAVHVPAVVAAPVVAAQGTYVAHTRGATHIAPLEGHANSAASVNLEPAPGTV